MIITQPLSVLKIFFNKWLPALFFCQFLLQRKMKSTLGIHLFYEFSDLKGRKSALGFRSSLCIINYWNMNMRGFEGFLLSHVICKTFQKIESVNKAFLFWYWQQPKNFFLGIELFVFQDRKLKPLVFVWKKKLWNLTKFQLNQKTDKKNETNNRLNEEKKLKFS